MNIFSQELKTSALSMLYWTIAILLFVLLFMFLYPPISKDIAVLESIMNNFPLQLRRALGITTLNLSEVLGYYGFIFEYVLLIGSVYAMALGLAVLSEEVRAQTADFLFSKPVDRSSIFKAKILSVLANLVVQNLLLASIAYMIIKAFAEVPFNKQALY
jgi:ABC-2 type transport system permease protein